ncbi:MAG: DUF11 domain-containing protein [Chloroflexota bacterium]|nr:DUF11 domain-containing protein [Chloroflexota bacterium]
MKAYKFFGIVIALTLLMTLSRAVSSSASTYQDPEPFPPSPHRVSTPARAKSSQAQQPIIIDHTCTDLSQIPEYWIEQAKAQLRLSYGHTSHGSQPVSGMNVLMNDPSHGGLYDFNTNGAIVPDTLSLADRTPSGDLGNPDRTTWAARTRDYLDGSGSDRNVVVWSWCGQADTSEENIDLYLSLMNQLEVDYPDVTFVYMTGHLNGTGIDGNLNVRNNQIRDYCIANNKILFDFADIESYDPDGNYYLDQGANDGCYYDGGNWANEWCAAHPGDPLCESCSCAHSEPLNCNLKARAFWWMLARIAGWETQAPDQPDLTPSYKSAAPQNTDYGERVTYTVVIRNDTGPLTSTVLFSDTINDRLSYVPGSLTATSGVVNDTAEPILHWSGVLSPTPAVTITYATTVTYITSGTATLILPQVITNTAAIAVPGYQPITRTETIWVHCQSTYMPLVMRSSP